MSHHGESLAEKQRRLAVDIARQRNQLTTAYRNLEKPLYYTEQGMRAFGFLRQNPWVLTVVPAAFSITSTVVALVRGQSAKPEKRARGWFDREARRDVEREAEREAKGFMGHAMKWGGRGWKAFRLYRRLRKFL